MGNLLWVLSRYPAAPATPTHTQRNPRRICQTPNQSTAAVGCVVECFGEFLLIRETIDARISSKDRVSGGARLLACRHHAGRPNRMARRTDRDARRGRQRHIGAV